MQQRLPRFRQNPDKVPLGEVSELCLDIIAIIERYRLISSSLLLALLGGNTRHAQSLLQKLFNHDYVKRFSLKAFGGSNDIYYYLDNRKALDELVIRRGVHRDSLDWAHLRLNRERPYMDVHDPAKRYRVLGRLPYIDHEWMISRFHGMLELYCRDSGGRVRLKRWLQGSPAHRRVEAPRLLYNPKDRAWQLGEGTETLAWRPDAFIQGH